MVHGFKISSFFGTYMGNVWDPLTTLKLSFSSFMCVYTHISILGVTLTSFVHYMGIKPNKKYAVSQCHARPSTVLTPLLLPARKLRVASREDRRSGGAPAEGRSDDGEEANGLR